LAGLDHFQNFTKEELDQLFAKFDYNNDTTIYITEFKAAIMGENFNSSLECFAK